MKKAHFIELAVRATAQCHNSCATSAVRWSKGVGERESATKGERERELETEIRIYMHI